MRELTQKQHAFEHPHDSPSGVSLSEFINSLINERHTINAVSFNGAISTIVTTKYYPWQGPTINIIHKGKLKPEIIEQNKKDYEQAATKTTCRYCDTVFEHTSSDASYNYSNSYMIDCPVCFHSLGEIYKH